MVYIGLNRGIEYGRCSICMSRKHMSLSYGEAIMRQRLIDRNISGVNVYSKGTGKWNLGEPPHEGTQDILNRHNIPFDGMISELFESSDDFDYIIAMDQSNVDNIQNINPNIKGKLFKLLEFSNMEE